MTKPNDHTEVAREHGGAATSSNETPVSSAENPTPVDDGTGNTPSTRPHPEGAKRFAGVDPAMSDDRDPDASHLATSPSRVPE